MFRRCFDVYKLEISEIYRKRNNYNYKSISDFNDFIDCIICFNGPNGVDFTKLLDYLRLDNLPSVFGGIWEGGRFQNKQRILLSLLLLSGNIHLNPGPVTRPIHNDLRIGTFNINSLSKDTFAPVDELQSNIISQLDVLAVQETKLDGAIKNSALFINNFDIHRWD